MDGTGGFLESFRLAAADGQAFTVSASVEVDGQADARAQIWARVDDGSRRRVILSNLEDSPVRAGAGKRDVQIAIYVPPGRFTVTFGGLVAGRATAAFSDIRIATRAPSRATTIAPEARDYLLNALDQVQQISLMTPAEGWAEWRSWALSQAPDARVPGDTYAALQLAVQRLLDRHSSFHPPQPDLPAQNPDGAATALPTPSRSPGILAIPSYLSPPSDRIEADRRFASGLARLLQETAHEQRCGLVIDLRSNSGGNMWPMLAGIGAVFPDQEMGRFVSSRGTEHWTAGQGRIYMDGKPVYTNVEPASRLDRMPVAVLVGPATASSGEALAIALRGRPRTVLVGRPTAGLVTSNRLIRLSDGASIWIASSRMADGRGVVQHGPIEPELKVQGEGDDVVVARQWLSRQCD